MLQHDYSIWLSLVGYLGRHDSGRPLFTCSLGVGVSEGNPVLTTYSILSTFCHPPPSVDSWHAMVVRTFFALVLAVYLGVYLRVSYALKKERLVIAWMLRLTIDSWQTTASTPDFGMTNSVSYGLGKAECWRRPSRGIVVFALIIFSDRQEDHRGFCSTTSWHP
jgi:hypothetical protein